MAAAMLAVALAAVTEPKAKGSGPDTGARVIPYSGTLEKDGVPVSGALPMQFTVTDGTNSWSYDAGTVTVFSGSFTVLIGESAPPGQELPAWVFAAEAVTVSVAVDGVELTGGQRIAPVPFSYWAAEGRDLDVAGSLTVRGPATVQGTLTVSPGNLALDGGTVDFKDNLGLKVDLYGTLFGLGVQPYTLYSRSYDKFAWYQGGVHTDTELDPGGGQRLMSLSSTGLAVTGGVSAASASVSGALSVGLESRNCPGAGECYCPAGKYALGGGVICPFFAGQYISPVNVSYPAPMAGSPPTGWVGTCLTNALMNYVTPDATYVICSRLAP